MLTCTLTTLIGSTQPATGGFGSTTSTPAFGQQQNQTPAFGQPQQQQSTGFGGFGQKPAGTTTTGGFGAPATTGGFGTGGFGSTATSKPATGGFSFNTPGQTGTTSTGFGGFGTSGTTGGFGTTTTSQPGGTGLFGANKPATSTPSLFGNTQTTTTGGFGTTGQTNTGFGSTGLFGANKPAGTTPSLFGNTQTGTTGFGGFGTQQQQQQPQNSFTLPTSGGLTSFGTMQPGQQNQQPLVATVDKNPYGTNPLFDTSKQGLTGAGGIKTGPSAVALEDTKKPTAPHYPMSPRVVSKIKLRGFTFTPTPKQTTNKRMSALEGISDDAVLGEGAFSPRFGNKKLIFKKGVNPTDVDSLISKKNDHPRVLFDPKSELAAAKKTSSPLMSSSTTTTATTKSSSSTGMTLSHQASGPSYASASEKEGYYLSPTLEALQGMTQEELKHVEKFTVGRRGYGEVKFDVPVDLSKLDPHDIMGKLVVIAEKRVIVYPDESQKAPQGTELNVPAIVRLEKCFSTDKDTKKPITDPEHPRFKLFVERLKARPGVEFIDYDKESGTWTFRVDSF